ncbi:VWA domain-containing protein [Treponema lecithinolyticum]|uniref:von Willebrand factor type A domain protein n=1 Tax=Treponema lecithinolyticum ATCC 700332 TaxID=1321815 RepID=A0ABN0P0I8_TRELE|nr:VWA domain-containing protein [Treponema lecithinolyticum]ERJ94011.1 von Willebrand factor type A domain protein [Treponema lecithinolyticum ATCC 700332]
MNKHPIKSFFLSVTVLCTVTLFGQTGKTELSVKIDQIISADYPAMTAYVVVQNEKGEPVTGLSPALFSTRIDSLEIKGKTSIIPFTMKEEPIDYSILFSNNGIMDGEPLDFQKNAILQFIDLMKDGDLLSLYNIGTEAGVIFEEQTKEHIDFAQINAINAVSDQPRVYDSLVNVLRKAERRKTVRKVIIVMSDGRDQNSRFTKEQLNAVLADTGIPVYAIGMRVLNNQSLSNLNEFAALSGGTYIYSATAQTIPGNLKKLLDIISRCYIIRYSIKNIKADNLLHYLEITVNERDAYGKGEKTFIAVKVPVPRWVRWVISGVIILVLILLIVLAFIYRIMLRKRLGITKRKCPDCGNIMKDNWDSCPFCKYLLDIKKKKKKRGKKE